MMGFVIKRRSGQSVILQISARILLKNQKTAAKASPIFLTETISIEPKSLPLI